MQKCEKGFFPLSQVQEQDIDGMRVSLNLPEYVDQDRLGVNLRGIYNMCKMGGIETIRVIGSMDGEVSTYTPTIVGINPDGAGIAGKAGLKTKVSTFSTSHPEIMDTLPGCYSWIDLSLDVNLREIHGRITDGKNKNLRNVSNWTPYIDKALRSGISKEGARHLIKDISPSQKLTFPTFMSTFAIIDLAATGFVPNSMTLPHILESFAIYGIGSQLLGHVLYHPGSKIRLSFFYGPQVDRALALKIMSKTGTLIKELKNTGKNIRPTDAK